MRAIEEVKMMRESMKSLGFKRKAMRESMDENFALSSESDSEEVAPISLKQSTERLPKSSQHTRSKPAYLLDVDEITFRSSDEESSVHAPVNKERLNEPSSHRSEIDVASS